MAIIVDSFPQRSPEWFAARVANPGASSVSKIITTTGEISKQRTEYLYQLAGEAITGKCEEGYQSTAMMQGSEREAGARALFEMLYDTEVRQAALVYKDDLKLYHCSPDGLPPNAVLEMKNPILKTHVKYLLDGKLPTDYFGQCQMSLHVTETELCYFMSAYEGMPPFILEVRRDEGFIAKLEPALLDFAADLARMVEKLRAMR